MPRFFRIHPSIGITRVGNSPTESFIGPERPGVPANYDARSDCFLPFKDAQGRIKRQAARFRVWEYQLRGGRLFPLREVNPGADGIVSIVWTVQLANRKAAFHEFDGQVGADGNWEALRNPEVKDRDELVIDPAPQSIEGPIRGPVAIALDPGVKPSIPIRQLGELRTDDRGNLLALGGHGESRSVAAPGTAASFLLDYANNDSWFDDMSDGPVTAVVDYRNERGRLEEADADPAWLVVGPPDFAPSVDNIVRLWDTMWDLAVRRLAVPDRHAVYDSGVYARLQEQRRDWDPQAERFRDYRPSYTQEIRPILERAIAARQVHDPEATRSFHANFIDVDDLLAAVDSVEGEDLRDMIFQKLRDPAGKLVDPKQMPKGLGDNYYDIATGENPEARTSPNRFMSVTHVQYALLRQWAENKFIADWKGPPPGPGALAGAAITPDGLDYAALENAVGAPFFPGIDVSWMVRQQGIYAEPFRLAHGARAFPELAEPSVGPGFFSQQMAIPWQADFYQCQKEPFKESNEGMYHMWWCAHRPDDVHVRRGDATMQPWARRINQAAEAALAAADAAGRPFPTAPGYTALDTAKFMQMQKDWARLGFVVRTGRDHFEVEADGEPAPACGNPKIAVSAGGKAIASGAAVDLGTALVGARGVPTTIVIQNTGPAPLRIPRIAIDDATDFRLLSLPPAGSELAPGASLSFQAVFEPGSPGRKTTTVRVDSNDPDVPTFSIQLGGEARAQTTLVVQPTTVAPGGTVTVTWSGVSNPTLTDWLGLYPSSSAPDSPAPVWQYTSSCTQTPGAAARASGSCTFTVPQTPGTTYEVRLFANNGYSRLATSAPFTVSAPVQPAHPPRLELKQYYSYTTIYEVPIANGQVVEFKEVRPNDPFTALCFYIENKGWGTLRIEGISLSDAQNFKATTETSTPQGPPPALPAIVNPLGRFILFVVYQPRTQGPHSTTVQLRTNDPTQPVLTFQITIPWRQQPTNPYGGGGGQPTNPYGGGGGQPTNPYGGGWPAGGAQTGGRLIVKQYYSYTRIYEVPVSNGQTLAFAEARPRGSYFALCFYLENSGPGELRITGLQCSDRVNFQLTEGVGAPNGRSPALPWVIPQGGRQILYLVYAPKTAARHNTTVVMQTTDRNQPQFTFSMQL